MAINLPLFLLGLALLWLPRRWMRLGKSLRLLRRKKHHTEAWKKQDRGDLRLDFRREFGKTRNYFDLLRGLVGSIVILGMRGIDPSLTAAEGDARGARLVLAVNFGVLLVGVLLQTLRRENGRMGLFAPVFYLAGISVPLCGPWGASFAFLLIWAINPLLANAQAFLTVYAILLAAFGMTIAQAGAINSAYAFLLCFLPALMSLLMRRSLSVFSRTGIRRSMRET